MAENKEKSDENKPSKSSGSKGLLLALVLFLVGGAGGFYALYSGLLLPSETSTAKSDQTPTPVADPAHPAPVFVSLQPIMVTLGRGDELEQLRFEGYLEVTPGTEENVTQLMPRVMDVLNGYLRAVEIGDLSDPSALMTLRSQMLRRIQVVVGEGRVNDLLISKFLLS